MDGEECQARILLKPQFIHKSFLGHFDNFFGATPHEESEFIKQGSIDLKREQYLNILTMYIIKSGNGRNVCKICLNIL